MKIKFLTILSIAAVMFMAACGKSDADLQKAVQEKLTADKVTGVSIVVNGGVATLSGEVADITVKNKAAASAGAVEGIKSVTNNVTVKPAPTPVPPPADPALTGKLNEELKKAGCEGITIAVANGTVTATGTVPDAKYVQCVQVINQSGLGKFENKLVRGK